MVATTPSYYEHISSNIPLEALCSKRNSTYVDVECEKLFDIPYAIQLHQSESTNCTSCIQIGSGNNKKFFLD